MFEFLLTVQLCSMMSPMTIKDSTAEMEVTVFENHAETMTDVRLDLMATSERPPKEEFVTKLRALLIRD